jgi:hypothetical protein
LAFALAVAAALACGTRGRRRPRGVSGARPPTSFPVSPGASVDELVAPIALYPDRSSRSCSRPRPIPSTSSKRTASSIAAKDKTLEPIRLARERAQPPEHSDVVRMMTEPGWTSRRRAVWPVRRVMDAIQRFRRQTEAAGNLASDDKQTVTSENEVIAIRSTDPQVVYVPSYDPAVVVMPAPAPVVSYYPTPYPWYYYPYGAGAALPRRLLRRLDRLGDGGRATDPARRRLGHVDSTRRRRIDIDRGDVNIDNSVKNQFEGGG